MKNVFPLLIISLTALCTMSSCSNKTFKTTTENTSSYFAITDTGIQTGGTKVIPINTPKGKFNVWTKG
jgi:proline iminopeptidase